MKSKRSPNLKLILLLIPIAAVVATSGCTGNSSGATFGTGVTILNWEPTFSAVESGDSLQFRIRVQNQGEVTANNVNAVITGITPEDWGVSGNAANFATLVPPDRVRNTEGEIRQETFDAVAPNLPKGTTQTFTPQVRVFYSYTTTASKLITVVNEGELKRLQDKGQTLSSKDTVSSAGPLKVTVNAGKFIKAKEAGFSYSRTFPITIDIQNVGGGVVSSQGTSTNDYKIKNFQVTAPSRLSISCLNSGGFYGSSIALWKGQTATVTCNVNIGQAPLASEEANIKVVLEYDYYIDSSTTVSVTGVDEGYGYYQ